ncbi:hypothetical protein ANO11243_045910 [Dothideomycetidae sp. 11243]|nr:hypothetical protein ANO11243_045910 [fungal sp. No.11243]
MDNMPTLKRPSLTSQTDSFQELIAQSEHEIRGWAGFWRANNTSVYTATVTTLSTPLHRSSRRTGSSEQDRASLRLTAYDDASRTMGALTPPIPDRAPGHSLPRDSSLPRLKKKPTPRSISLRELRAKQSEAALRSMYETQTDVYLKRAISSSRRSTAPRTRWTKWSMSESSGEDEDFKEEPDE